MSAKDPRKSIELTLSPDLLRALRRYRDRRRIRGLAAAARDALRRAAFDDASAAPVAGDGGAGRALVLNTAPRRVRLRLQLEPALRRRLGLAASCEARSQSRRLEGLLRAALGLPADPTV